MTVSVFEYLFRGEKDLFKGTWICDKWSWEPFPVVRLDMNSLNTENPELLKQAIDDEMRSLSVNYGVELKRSTYDGKFYELIEKLSEKSKKNRSSCWSMNTKNPSLTIYLTNRKPTK
ncbi:hypothetical protein A4H02_00600 [Fervidobacterium thailandense]|uniref:AAA-ATPase-like domain-containing protein n=1 Tax=Fervidobacterium thailandense TaxID=1008305 RepID=A0A1E3G4V7_9BACT|nr:hypothetical protein A4H02_00600 [Fervidobacterium thailandense]